MNKFIFRLLAFVGVLGLCAVLVDYFIAYRMSTSMDHRYDSWNEICADSAHFDMVIVGASEALTGYNPEILDSILGCKTFVCAFDGSGMNRQIIKFSKFCQIHGLPNVYVQSVDMSVLGITYGYEREQIFPFFLHDRKLMHQFDEYEHFTWCEKYIPCYRYLGYSRDIIQAAFGVNESMGTLHRGYYPKATTYDGLALSKRDSVSFYLDENQLHNMCVFLDSIRSLGTEVVMAYTPIYKNALDKCTNKEMAVAKFDSIATVAGCHVLCYYDSPLGCDSTFFSNATHLNKWGSDIYSIQFANDLKNLMLFKSKE